MPLSLMQAQDQQPQFFEAIFIEYLLLPTTEERTQTHTYEVKKEKNTTTLHMKRIEPEKKMPPVFGLSGKHFQ